MIVPLYFVSYLTEIHHRERQRSAAIFHPPSHIAIGLIISSRLFRVGSRDSAFKFRVRTRYNGICRGGGRLIRSILREQIVLVYNVNSCVRIHTQRMYPFISVISARQTTLIYFYFFFIYTYKSGNRFEFLKISP